MAKMDLKRLASFCRRMHLALHAGIDIRHAWRTESQRGPVSQRPAMAEIANQISVGHAMADAMKQQGNLFPPLVLQMVDVGERTGRLEVVLLRLAEHYDQMLGLRKTFLQGIAWPAIQLGAGILIIGFMILVLGLLNPGMGVFGLSGPKGLLIYLTIILLVAGTATLLVLGLIKSWFGPWPMRLVINTPVVGTALRTMALARMAWCLEMALEAGIDARRSMRMALFSTQNDYFTSHAAEIDDVLRRGGQFHESLRVTGVFPDEFVDWLESAELTGTQTESLAHLAEEYRRRAASALQALTIAATFLIWGAIMIIGAIVVVQLFYSIYIKNIYDALEPI